MVMGYITRKRAYHMLKTGRNLKKLFQLIKPHVLEKDPDALYIYACFTLDEWNEDEETFLARRIKYLHFAAKYGVLEALHELGLYYHTGQGIEQDKNKAAGLFKAAAERGHSYSKLYYGLDLFYGSCGIEKDEGMGVLYVREAVDEGVEDAYQSLQKITMLRDMTEEERAAYFEEEKQKATAKKKKKVSRVKLTVDPPVEEDKEIADILDRAPEEPLNESEDEGEAQDGVADNADDIFTTEKTLDDEPVEPKNDEDQDLQEEPPQKVDQPIEAPAEEPPKKRSLMDEVIEIKPRGGVFEEEDDGFFDDLDIDSPPKQKESEDI